MLCGHSTHVFSHLDRNPPHRWEWQKDECHDTIEQNMHDGQGNRCFSFVNGCNHRGNGRTNICTHYEGKGFGKAHFSVCHQGNHQAGGHGAGLNSRCKKDSINERQPGIFENYFVYILKSV